MKVDDVMKPKNDLVEFDFRSAATELAVDTFQEVVLCC